MSPQDPGSRGREAGPSTEAGSQPVRVAFVAGAGRSGSTLLECMLGELEGVVSCGEVTHLWGRGGVEDQLCGCERPFSECEFWSAVVEEAFGGPDQVNFRALADLRDRVCAFPRFPQLAVPALRTPGFDRDIQRYGRALTAVYRAVRTISDCRVMVDSSKYPPEAYLVSRLEGMDPMILHIVRHPSGVAHAWRKRKRRPEVHWEERYFDRYSLPTTAMAWNTFNAVIERLESRGVARELVRYEDLVRAPHQTIRRAAARLGIEDPDLGFVSGSEVRLGTNHTVSGNPSRFRRGSVPLRLDLEWTEAAPRLQRALVRALTLPVRRRYGYG